MGSDLEEVGQAWSECDLLSSSGEPCTEPPAWKGHSLVCQPELNRSILKYNLGQEWDLKLLHPVFLLQKEERTMLEDIRVTLSELDNVTFSFKQLDENCVASE